MKKMRFIWVVFGCLLLGIAAIECGGGTSSTTNNNLTSGDGGPDSHPTGTTLPGGW